MFTMERFNHSRTQVYGDRCMLFSVDTLTPADKMEKVKNGLKFERFDVFSDSCCAQPAWSALNEEWERSSVGSVRFCSARAVQVVAPEALYLPANPSEFPRLMTVADCHAAFERGGYAVHGPFGTFATVCLSERARPESILTNIHGARSVRHRLCNLTLEPAVGRMDRSPDGNIARLRTKVAERQLDEEMTQ
jgi:hypothetical protein